MRPGVFSRAAIVAMTVAALSAADSGLSSARATSTPDVRSASRLAAGGYSLPKTSTQLIVGVASDWGSNHVVLQRFERRKGGKWQPVDGRIPGRLGASGLAWGRGLHPLEPSPQGSSVKREGDNRSPAGVFTLGDAFGYAADVKRHPQQPYVQVTPYDLLVDDPTSPSYNGHIRLDHLPATPWEQSQQMEQNNPAHALEVMINHNMVPAVVPGAGSLILFHIWRRDGASNTAGCTTMSERELRSLVAWIDPTRQPLYVLLPQPLYDSLASPWGLPASMKGVAMPPVDPASGTAGSRPQGVGRPGEHQSEAAERSPRVTAANTSTTTSTSSPPVSVAAKPVTRVKKRR